MHNLGTVFRFEFTRTIKKPTFWISVLAFPVILGALVAIIYFSNQAADQASIAANNERFSIQVSDESGFISDQAIVASGASRADSKEAGVAAVRDNQVDAFFYYPTDPSNQPVEVYGKDVGLTKNSRYEAAANMILQGGVAASVESQKAVALLQGDSRVVSTTYADGEIAAGFEQVIAPGVFLVLFYAVIVLLAGQMLASTTEEKENRVIEMVLTTIHARTLIIGKILAIMALGFLQIAVILVPVVLAYIFLRDELNIPAIDLASIPVDTGAIVVGAMLLVSGFMLFTGILVAIGAAVPTVKEANNFLGFIFLLMFLPFYAGATIVTDSSQMIVKVLSFFPLTSPITLMVRNAVGNLSTIEAVIGITILFISGIIALTIAIRTFRYGSIEYARRISFKELFARNT